jgi:aryl-alcohol dehydrogenase-like predicted oxidoreductase
MHFRHFGKEDTAVSEVGLGTWQLGGKDFGYGRNQTSSIQRISRFDFL